MNILFVTQGISPKLIKFFHGECDKLEKGGFAYIICCIYLSLYMDSVCSGLTSTCDSAFTFIICPHVTTNTVFHKQIISQMVPSPLEDLPLLKLVITFIPHILAQHKLSMLLFWHLICISFIEVR